MVKPLKILYLLLFQISVFVSIFSQNIEKETIPDNEFKDFGDFFNPAFSDSIIVHQLFVGDYPYFQDIETPILGWSKNGKIAFIYFWEPKEPVGTLANLVILDLKKGNELLKLELYDGSAISTENIMIFRKEMVKNKIRFQKTKISPFPACFNNDSLLVNNSGSKHFIVKKSREKKQNILELENERFAILGYAISPFDNRMVVYYNMSCGVTVAEIAQYESFSTFFNIDLNKWESIQKPEN
jgi:hypothetical protein